MKKTSLLFFINILFLSLPLVSCSDDELKETRGIVDSLSNDTLVVNIQGVNVSLLTTDLQPSNTAIMSGDSVKLYYVGSLSSGKAKAMLLTLIPPVPTVVEAGYDESKELKTAEHP